MLIGLATQNQQKAHKQVCGWLNTLLNQGDPVPYLLTYFNT